MNNSVIVIDVGSSKIIAVSGERGVNGTFAIDAFSELRYEGFSEGKFFDEGVYRPMNKDLTVGKPSYGRLRFFEI